MSVETYLHAPGRRVTLCENFNRKGGKLYAGFEVRESVHGSGVARHTFAKRRMAVKYAQGRAKILAGQTADFPRERAVMWTEAERHLIGTGKNPEQAMSEYGLAKAELIGLDVPLQEVARFYMANHGQGSKSIKEIVAELLERRQREGVSAVHLLDLRLRLTRFASEINCSIGSLTAPVIQEWLDSLAGLSIRTVRNYRNAISNLVSYAKTHKYLPQTWSELTRLDRIRVPQQSIEIFTPGEMLLILTHATASIIPAIAIGSFAGLRTSEIHLLTWRNIDWQQNSLIVPPEGKTKERRVPMEPNLRSWLEPHSSEGEIMPLSKHGFTKALKRTLGRVNRALPESPVNWKHNGMRHSYASYKARLEENPYRVATWTGHSVSTLRRFYCNETVTNESARSWFAIEPAANGAQDKIVAPDFNHDRKNLPGNYPE